MIENVDVLSVRVASSHPADVDRDAALRPAYATRSEAIIHVGGSSLAAIASAVAARLRSASELVPRRMMQLSLAMMTLEGVQREYHVFSVAFVQIKPRHTGDVVALTS